MNDGDKSIAIIIPTLNEAPTIGELIDNIHSLNLSPKPLILIVDGGSIDNTVEICEKKNTKIIFQRRKGKGSAIREAVDQIGEDIIIFIDGDGTYSIPEIELLLEPLLEDKADMVVGSRIHGDSKKEKGSISGFNALGNKLFNRTINFAMKSRITDSLSGYRALYTTTFKELILFSDSFEIEVEMTVEALAKGFRILEVPISYGVRKGSQTKLNPIKDGLRIARTLLFILMNVNPLKFFGLISLMFFIVGLYPGLFVLNEKITTGEILSMPSVVFSSLLFVTGTISLVVGLLSELVVRSRRRLEYLITKNEKSNRQIN
ncbi:MAG: glycosyltransferase [Candidatus Nitrosocosmicus sp.]|jgi:dolichol-phosphate mannosyltransferase|uniref:glycosyltransferase n=1 Tax=Candidatus Nitrosocosmicus sp. FF01 TaxID=3397670 RepID=UPI002A7136D0|nr:TIGR04182 family glycosyltransferase [Candidatus Nitrosocosmicus sp.]GKS62237.1 glycosyltransferase, TIGR04182 family [Candidatus Nitrosocosmicus sp.]